MIRKIIFFSLIITVTYFFYNPIVFELRESQNSSGIKFKPNHVFKLKDVLDLKDVKELTVYLVLDREESRYFSSKVPKWKILKTNNINLIKDLLNCEFIYTNSDISTVQSKIFIFSGGKLVFESEISLEDNQFGLQNTYTGWVSPIDNNEFIMTVSKFDRYNVPFFIIR